jgi:hypothetical protein
MALRLGPRSCPLGRRGPSGGGSRNANAKFTPSSGGAQCATRAGRAVDCGNPGEMGLHRTCSPRARLGVGALRLGSGGRPRLPPTRSAVKISAAPDWDRIVYPYPLHDEIATGCLVLAINAVGCFG